MNEEPLGQRNAHESRSGNKYMNTGKTQESADSLAASKVECGCEIDICERMKIFGEIMRAAAKSIQSLDLSIKYMEKEMRDMIEKIERFEKKPLNSGIRIRADSASNMESQRFNNGASKVAEPVEKIPNPDTSQTDVGKAIVRVTQALLGKYGETTIRSINRCPNADIVTVPEGAFRNEPRIKR